MRKEYIPAIILYVVSALFYFWAACCVYTDSHHWATVGLVGVIIMLFASSLLTKIGKKLREDGEREEKNDKQQGNSK